MQIDDSAERYSDVSDALKKQLKVDGFRILSHSVNGKYLLFSDGRIYLNTQKHRYLTGEFKRLRAHISNEA